MTYRRKWRLPIKPLPSNGYSTRLGSRNCQAERKPLERTLDARARKHLPSLYVVDFFPPWPRRARRSDQLLHLKERLEVVDLEEGDEDEPGALHASPHRDVPGRLLADVVERVVPH